MSDEHDHEGPISGGISIGHGWLAIDGAPEVRVVELGLTGGMLMMSPPVARDLAARLSAAADDADLCPGYGQCSHRDN